MRRGLPRGAPKNRDSWDEMCEESVIYPRRGARLVDGLETKAGGGPYISVRTRGEKLCNAPWPFWPFRLCCLQRVSAWHSPPRELCRPPPCPPLSRFRLELKLRTTSIPG